MSVPAAWSADSVKRFVENPIVLSPLLSWFLSQLLKSVIALLRRSRRGAREILVTIAWRTGGMPSSHAALVSSMAASAAFKEGLASNLFALSFWFALITMRDAMGVRRATGQQARSINLLGRNTAEALGIDFRPVKEIEGHSPLEVAVGAFLGIFIAAALVWL